MEKRQPDFTGWATRNDIKCSDGRIIRHNAFADCDGKKVPLVWNHQHNSADNVIGHALLENRDEGVYTYGFVNETPMGQVAREQLKHGDITQLSIYANQLKQRGADVVHGMIREVSLVLAGANPGAFIDSVLVHSDDEEFEATIYTGEDITLSHGEDESAESEDVIEHADEKKEDDNVANEKKPETSDNKSEEKTVQDVIDSMNEDQKTVLYAMVGEALDADESDEDEDADNDNSEGGNSEMKHNVFDTDGQNTENVLSHSDMNEIVLAAKANKVSFKRVLEDTISENEHLAHGIDDIESLFPEYRDIRPGAPEMITRDLTWVDQVMNKTHKTPFTRIRTRQADVRGDDLRAFGYKKGKFKQQPGNIKLLKRTTDPQTVYRKDSLHRDDIIDITDFDVVEYQYQVMKQNLSEELALAIMIGDGRDEGDEMKISEEHIRPIWTDDDLYTIHYDVDIEGMKSELQGSATGQHFGENYIYAEAIIQSALYARENYKGSGSLEFYCTPHLLNVMLLARDLNGRRIYSSKADLQAALNVTAIHTAEQFEGKTRTTKDTSPKTKKLLGLFVNLSDYSVGHTRGGEITRFNQFDIDFNQEKYLIETRLSGALTRVYSAIALEEDITE